MKTRIRGATHKFVEMSLFDRCLVFVNREKNVVRERERQSESNPPYQRHRIAKRIFYI